MGGHYYDLPRRRRDVPSRAVSGLLLLAMFLAMCAVFFGTVTVLAWVIDVIAGMLGA